MARNLSSPFYDGYTYRHGPFACTFHQNKTAGTWIIVAEDHTTGREIFRTKPAPTKFDAYRIAESRGSVLVRDGGAVAQLLVRDDLSFEADEDSLRVRDSAA